MPLRIGVNALFLIPGAVGGTEVYLRNLLAALAQIPNQHEYFVFLNRETGADLVPPSPNFHAIQTGVNATSRPRRILYEQTGFLPAIRAAKIDILFNPGFTSPHLSRVPNVTVIHDLQHHHHPEYFKPADRLAWRLFVWASAHTAHRIVTVSEASREDIHAVYNVPLANIHTAEPGVEPELFNIKRDSSEPLILCVSTLHPHKNIERLIDAFAAFHPRHRGYKLVLAGMRGFHAAAVERRIAHHNLQKEIEITGWLPRPEILNLYARARFAIFPSIFEGFGMPVVEAMAAGVPLITTDIRPMNDTAGDTALLFPPNETAALIEAMERFANDEGIRTAYAARARQRASRYTWHRAATAVLQALENAAAKR